MNMTNEENKVVRKIPQVIQVKREPWDTMRAERTIIPVIISILLTQILLIIFIVSLIFLSTFLAGLAGQVGNEVGLITSIIVVVIMIDILYIIFSLAFWKSVIYELKSHTFEIIREFVDARSGRITIYSGFFMRRMRIFQVSEYTTVSVLKDLFGNFFNYGTILVSNNEKPKVRKIRLRAVKSPNDFARIIQSMIDTTTSSLQYVDSDLIKKENVQTKEISQKKMYEGNDYVE